MTQENWKEEFDKKLPLYTFVYNSEYGSELKIEEVKDFISTLLTEERELQNKLKEIAINKLITDVNTARKEERNAVLSEVEREVGKLEYCSKCCSPKEYCTDWGEWESAVPTKDILKIINNLK